MEIALIMIAQLVIEQQQIQVKNGRSELLTHEMFFMLNYPGNYLKDPIINS